ncbi:MAG: short chain dehydrogenase, partial [Patescibacteria group bacterium]|nr:short chain dehydrogenase [Patescibacteria group bacterium]
MENKVIVITGASRGLGKALAKAFTSKGAKVIIS